MNILYIITGLGIGGAEKITIDLANLMYSKGNNVAIIYLYGSNEYPSLIHKSILLYGLSMLKTPKSFYHSLMTAKKIIKKFHPDVVHAQMFHANIFARILRLFCNIPYLICTEHSKNIEGKFRMKLYSVTDFLSDINTNVSIEATEYFISQRAFKRSKSFPMYNGIDLIKFKRSLEKRYEVRSKLELTEKDFIFLNVGRLVPAKNQAMLLEAFATLVQEFNVEAKLIIVGDGPLASELHSIIDKLCIRDQIFFVGFQSNVYDYYSAADCFVLSSAWEGFGIVLAEAMGSGLPVVTTDAGGCAEVIDEPYFTISLNDSFAMSRKMKEIYDMSLIQRVELGKRNMEKAKRFDINIICNKWLEIYFQRSSI